MNTNLNSSTLSSPESKLTYSETRENRTLVLTKPLNQLDLPTQEQKKSIALIYIEQAKVYCQEHNWSKAILACKNALEITSNLADAYKILGDILYRQGKQAEALGIYAKALTINPNLATVYANVGALYADREDWQKALDYYQQAVILDPNLAETYRNLAQIWEELGDGEKALECLCRAIDLDSTILDAEDYFNFGKELSQQGKLKEASILFTHGIKLNPFAETELAQLVQMLEDLEEWQQAVVYYHQLISLPDAKSDRLVKSSHQKSASYKPIRKLLSSSKSNAIKVIAKDTKNNMSLVPKDVAQKLLPKVETKIAKQDSNTADISQVDTNQASQQKPDSALSWNNLGSIYAQKEQWEKAISCYQEALQLDCNFAKSYRNLARVYHKTGEHLKASLYWHEAFSIEPNLVKPEEYFSLAKRLLQYQQKEKAIVCLQRTIELNPDFKNAQTTLKQLINSREN